MRMAMKIGLAVIVMGFFANFFSGGHPDQSVDIPALIQNGALVVDVRTPGEFSGGHIEDAVNIPYDLISRDIGSYAPDKDRAIILYCRSGPRASAAKKSLIRAGYTQVINASSFRKMRKILAPK